MLYKTKTLDLTLLIWLEGCWLCRPLGETESTDCWPRRCARWASGCRLCPPFWSERSPCNEVTKSSRSCWGNEIDFQTKCCGNQELIYLIKQVQMIVGYWYGNNVFHFSVHRNVSTYRKQIMGLMEPHTVWQQWRERGRMVRQVSGSPDKFSVCTTYHIKVEREWIPPHADHAWIGGYHGLAGDVILCSLLMWHKSVNNKKMPISLFCLFWFFAMSKRHIDLIRSKKVPFWCGTEISRARKCPFEN